MEYVVSLGYCQVCLKLLPALGGGRELAPCRWLPCRPIMGGWVGGVGAGKGGCKPEREAHCTILQACSCKLRHYLNRAAAGKENATSCTAHQQQHGSPSGDLALLSLQMPQQQGAGQPVPPLQPITRSPVGRPPLAPRQEAASGSNNCNNAVYAQVISYMLTSGILEELCRVCALPQPA